ncbi:MAG: DUF5107 domain-containing protein [Spirochaetes bacterium]|nr:DUF5107 domain-containing protein [Spirochaetota bacterium]
MFPSIDGSFYPDGIWAGTPIPDHGEVWGLPWKCDVHCQEIQFSVHGVRFPYQIIKKITLNGWILNLNYQFINHSDYTFHFIWALHALLNGDAEDTIIHFPQEVKNIINVDNQSSYLGQWGEIYDYPIAHLANGSELDLSRLEPKKAKNHEKYYVPHPLTNGSCSIEYQKSRERLIYHFPVDKVPYLGIWKNHGWLKNDYNFALEPCTGLYDDLYLAHKMKKSAFIPPRSSYEFTFKMEIHSPY